MHKWVQEIHTHTRTVAGKSFPKVFISYFFWTLFKNVHCQGPCSLRLCILRPYCISTQMSLHFCRILRLNGPSRQRNWIFCSVFKCNFINILIQWCKERQGPIFTNQHIFLLPRSKPAAWLPRIFSSQLSSPQ